MGKRTPSKWLTLMAVCFGLLMLYIDLFIVNVALPTIAHDFRAPLATVFWTVSAYVLMIGLLPEWTNTVVIEHLRRGIAPHLSLARSVHSRGLLVHDACCGERRPDEAVRASLWNTWDGAQ
jgi:hypothetical protein